MKSLKTTEFASGLIFGEGPRWRDGRLYVSDMLGLQILSFDAHGHREVVADVPEKPNGLAFLPDGTLLFTSMHDARLYRLEHGTPVLHADLRSLVTGYLGDMVVDAAGRAYVDDVGARVFEGEQMRPGRLILVEPDGRARVAAEDFAFANGIVITSDHRTLIVAESMAQRLTALDIDPNGGLSHRRVYKDLSGLRGPFTQADGLAIDAEDALWISLVRAGEFIRLDRSGEITHSVAVGDAHAVACALGGEDGRTLFLVTATTAPGTDIFEEMAQRRTKARILMTRVDTPRGEGRP